MFRAAIGKRRVVDQCGNTALAAKPVLDAAGAELHHVDDGSVSMDVLRNLSPPGGAWPLRGRYCLLFARNPVNRRLGFTPSPQARRIEHGAGLSGFRAAVDVVDFSLCVCGSALDVCNPDARSLQHELRHPDVSTARSDHDWIRDMLAAHAGSLAHRVPPPLRGNGTLRAFLAGDQSGDSAERLLY